MFLLSARLTFDRAEIPVQPGQDLADHTKAGWDVAGVPERLPKVNRTTHVLLPVNQEVAQLIHPGRRLGS